MPLLHAEDINCATGEWRCSENKTLIYGCNNNSWQLSQTCVLPEICIISDTEVKCGIPPKVCVPGLRRCQTGDIEKCSNDGTAWESYISCKNGCELSSQGLPKCFSEQSNMLEDFPNQGLLPIILIVIFGVFILIMWIFCLVDIFSSGNKGIWKLLWIIIVTATLIVGIIIYFILRKKSRMIRGYNSSYPSYSGYTAEKPEKKKSKAKKTKPHVGSISPALIDYINAARKNKIDDEKIKKNLLSVGWAEDKVNDAFEYLGQEIE